MQWSFKIGSIWGIPIRLHITFVLLMALVLALSYQNLYFFYLVLFLFIFVVVHELSHSYVARRYNIKVRDIVLYPIGGVSEIEEIPENPRVEWRMAIAGPLSSLVIGAVLFVLGQYVVISTPTASVFGLGNFLSDLGYLNLLLGAFNFIPAFPMDGGRVLRALLAEKMKFVDATRYAALIGRALGILMAIFGIFYNIFLVFIGIFIYVGAGEEAESTIVSESLANVRVRDVMSPEVASVRPEMSLTEAMDIMFKARYHDALVEREGVFQGIVTWQEIMKVKSEQRSQMRVEQLQMKQISAFPDQAVLEAYKVMIREKIDLMPVVDKGTPAKVIGVVTNESVSSAYERARRGQQAQPLTRSNVGQV